VDRVRNMVVRVGTTEAGLVVPHPSYWAKNGLTERGLRDAAVQKVLAGIRQRQIDYMNRLTPILQAHVDARILEQGPAAMVQALPEGERAEARQYSKTVMWKTAMEWLVEDGRRLSRIGLKRWKKACEKESVSRFAEAANALRQHQRWPLDLEPRTLAEL